MSHRISITGNLTRTPEIKEVAGRIVAEFILADTHWVSKDRLAQCPKDWHESYNGKGWEYTIFWKCSAWNGVAQSVKGLVSGNRVEVEGQVTGGLVDGVAFPRAWANQDGEVCSQFTLTAYSVKWFVQRAKATPVPQAQAPVEYHSTDPEAAYDWPTAEPPVGF